MVMVVVVVGGAGCTVNYPRKVIMNIDNFSYLPGNDNEAYTLVSSCNKLNKDDKHTTLAARITSLNLLLFLFYPAAVVISMIVPQSTPSFFILPN